MTVRELIEELRGLNQDALVVMSQDPEGNRFSPLDELGEGLYEDNEIYNLDEVEDKLPDAVVLWPL